MNLFAWGEKKDRGKRNCFVRVRGVQYKEAVKQTKKVSKRRKWSKKGVWRRCKTDEICLFVKPLNVTHVQQLGGKSLLEKGLSVTAAVKT